jgi:hypothetical protein
MSANGARTESLGIGTQHQHFRAHRIGTAPLPGDGVGMGSSDTPATDSSGPIQPLQYNLALLAHLVFLVRRTQSEQQQRYLEWASNVIEEMQRHPTLQA